MENKTPRSQKGSKKGLKKQKSLDGNQGNYEAPANVYYKSEC